MYIKPTRYFQTSSNCTRHFRRRMVPMMALWQAYTLARKILCSESYVQFLESMNLALFPDCYQVTYIGSKSWPKVSECYCMTVVLLIHICWFACGQLLQNLQTIVLLFQACIRINTSCKQTATSLGQVGCLSPFCLMRRRSIGTISLGVWEMVSVAYWTSIAPNGKLPSWVNVRNECAWCDLWRNHSLY